MLHYKLQAALKIAYIIFLSCITIFSYCQQGVKVDETGNIDIGKAIRFQGVNLLRVPASSTFSLCMGNSANNTFTGANNIFVGNNCATNISTGYQNIFLGYACGYNCTSIKHSAVFGYEALGIGIGTGDYNVIVGWRAGYRQTSAENNVFLGAAAGQNITTGGNNIFIGGNAGNNTTSQINNIAIGNLAGYSNIANSNTYIGFLSGRNATTGMLNVAIGYASAGNGILTGNFNFCLGQYSGYSLGVGAKNLFVGFESGYSCVAGSQNVFIGYQSGYLETGSNKLYIDNSNTTTPLIYGDFTTNTLTINDILVVHPTTIPGSPVEGMIYMNSSDHHLYLYNGSGWIQIDN